MLANKENGSSISFDQSSAFNFYRLATRLKLVQIVGPVPTLIMTNYNSQLNKK